MENKRLKIEVTVTERDYIDYGFHAFINKRGKSRNFVLAAFFIFLLIQSVREMMIGTGNYLYPGSLLVLLIFPPINIYTNYKSYFKKNWAHDPTAIYTIDENSIRIKRRNSSDKKEINNISKITENKKALYIWWKDSIETSVIPKSFVTGDEIDFIKNLEPISTK